MRKIILQLALSLDGYIEGPNGEYDWCFTDQDYGMQAFLSSIDTIIYGRKSYELLASTGDTSFQHFKTIVCSSQKNLKINDAEVWNDHLLDRVNHLKKTSGKSIWFFGGADLLNFFLQHNLIDEFRIALHPILLGAGKPLFQKLSNRQHLQLLNVQQYNSGLVMLQYEKR